MATQKKDFSGFNPAMQFISEQTPKEEAQTYTKNPKLVKRPTRNKRLQLLVTEELFDRLHETAVNEGMSMNEIVAQALEQILS